MIKYHFEYLAIDRLLPNPLRPRFQIDQKQLLKLADSIRQYGVINPILVGKTAAGLQIIAGERRWRAAKIAGLAEIPGMVCEASSVDLILLFLEENLNRISVNLIEQAEAINNLIVKGGFNFASLSKRFKIDEEEIAQIHALRKIPEKIKEMYLTGKINNDRLLYIAKHPDPLVALHETDS